MKKPVIYFCFLFIQHVLFAQDVAFTKTNFPDDKKGLKAASKNIKKGDFYYNTSSYKQALPYYLEAYTFNAKNAALNSKIGDCHFSMGERDKAEKYLKRALRIDAGLDGYFVFLMAQIAHSKHDFLKALNYYQDSRAKGSLLKPNALAGLDKKIKECNYAQTLVEKPVEVDIANVGNAINTSNQEYVPVISADGSEMFFTSRRPGGVVKEVDANIKDYFEDIYYSSKDENGDWNKAKNMGKPINSEYHDATVSLSSDGRMLLIYRDTKEGNGDILVAEKNGTSWTKPVALPQPINSEYQESSACYDYTGKTIYFVSDRPGGNGGKDIYKATQQDSGVWGAAENLGSVINSGYDEDAVFIHPDGKTLYYSSNGYNTMGGYDIFKSVYDSGNWSTPVNIGFPINSADDDVCFVVTADGKSAYYTSERLGGEGKKDIYKVTFKEKEEKKRPTVALMEGYVYDKTTNAPIKATIEVYDHDKNRMVAKYSSNAETGNYMFPLKVAYNYDIIIKNEGYFYNSEYLPVPDLEEFQEFTREVKLERIDVGKKMVLKDIYYNYNKASLTEESYPELDRAAELLTQNPNMEIELGTHCDSRGSAAYNLALSQRRAQTCVDYLKSKGIKEERLNAKGYGETVPIVTDAEINKMATEEEKEAAHKKNRRAEFRVIKKD